MRAEAEAALSGAVLFLEWRLEAGHLKKDVDEAVLRANVLMTPWERLEKHQRELGKCQEW